MVDAARSLRAYKLVEHVATHRLRVALFGISPPASPGRRHDKIHWATSHGPVDWRRDDGSVGGAAADRARGASVSPQHAEAGRPPAGLVAECRFGRRELPCLVTDAGPSPHFSRATTVSSEFLPPDFDRVSELKVFDVRQYESTERIERTQDIEAVAFGDSAGRRIAEPVVKDEH